MPYSVLERFVSLGIIRKSSMPDEYQEKDFERLGLADILLNAGFSAEDIQKYFLLEESYTLSNGVKILKAMLGSSIFVPLQILKQALANGLSRFLMKNTMWLVCRTGQSNEVNL